VGPLLLMSWLLLLMLLGELYVLWRCYEPFLFPISVCCYLPLLLMFWTVASYDGAVTLCCLSYCHR
jgi:hypothetical protein